MTGAPLRVGEDFYHDPLKSYSRRGGPRREVLVARAPQGGKFCWGFIFCGKSLDDVVLGAGASR